jgi:hypothetical protein
MDSLGGILTDGLLGNSIIARFNLFIFNIEIDVPQKLIGNSSSYNILKQEDEEYGRVNIKLRLFNSDYQKYYNFSKAKINIIIRMIKFIQNIKERMVNIKFRKMKVNKIQVKFNEKD